MVIDKHNGLTIPRYLLYDIIRLENRDVSKEAFFPNRLNYIKKYIIEPRYAAIQNGIIKKEREPFSVRDKQFWELTATKSLLGPKFAKSLSHEPDGLIFQPSVEVSCGHNFVFFLIQNFFFNIYFSAICFGQM